MRKPGIWLAASFCLPLCLLSHSAVNGSENTAIPEQSEQVIDHYCTSNLAERRQYCLTRIIPSLEKEPSDSSLDLLAMALRKLRDWTDDDPVLVNDLRRREQAVYEEILRRNPQDSEALFFLAVSQESTDEGNALLRQLLDYEPGHDAAARVLAINLLESGESDEVLEAFERLRAAYENTTRPWSVILAAEAVSALGRIDKNAADRFRRAVKEDYGVNELLARAKSAVESGAPIADKIPAAKVLIDKYCSEPYLLFDTGTCKQGVAFMIVLEESAPRNAQILHAIIAGMQGLHWPGFGPASDYTEELRDRIERLMEVEGRSEELLSQYAAVLNGEEQIVVLEGIIAVDRHAPAQVHAALGRAQINAGRYVQGIEELRTAFERAKGRDKGNLGSKLVQALRVYGTPQEAMEAERLEQMLQQM